MGGDDWIITMCGRPLSGSYGAQIGLCVGFSLLSFVEVAYFFTWRVWKEIEKVQKRRREKRAKGKRRKVEPFHAVDLKAGTFYNSLTDRVFLW